jgi:hypothetical protein
MITVTKADDLKFQCITCGKYELPTAHDTLQYTSIIGSSLAQFKEILTTAGEDPLNPLVEQNCTCGHNRVRQIRLGIDMQQINTCVKCKKQWLALEQQ